MFHISSRGSTIITAVSRPRYFSKIFSLGLELRWRVILPPPQLICPLAPAHSRQSMIKNFGGAVTVRLKIYSMKKGKYSLALAIYMARFVHAFQ